MKFNIMMLVFGVFLAGCQGHGTLAEPQQQAQTKHSADFNGVWQVESIDRQGTIESSIVTFDFSKVVNKVVGSTGCNQYSTDFKHNGSTIEFSPIAMTKMACVQDIAQQEQLFLNALKDVKRYEFKSKTAVILFDKKNRPRLELKQLKRSE